MRILVVMDRPETINPKTDTTLVIVEEARARGHAVDVCGPDRLEIADGAVVTWSSSVTATARDHLPCITVGVPERRGLADYQLVLMRKDPPFNLDYYYATLLFERARNVTRIVNDPRGLRDANEKLYILNFPSLIARTCVTRSIAELHRFLDAEAGQMIVKPLDGCGGAGIFHVRSDDRNTSSIFEAVTCFGSKLVMAQHYLPAAREGDKRILLLDGEPLGAVLRVPLANETRGNLHVGAVPTKTSLTARDLEICATLAPRLRADGLSFVGIDVIGDWLTEVNVTSPTGVQEVDRLEGTRLSVRIVDWLESAAHL